MSGADRLSLWPSIDLLGGRVVRLLRGERKEVTSYDADAVEVAARFAKEGADGVHLVDLDAAFGTGENTALIEAIVAATPVPVQVGGGLRNALAVERVLAAGAARAVLGTLPFASPALFADLAVLHPGRLVVAVDCRDGRPTVRGWTSDAGAGRVEDALPPLLAECPAALLVTDVSRDGAMAGPGLDLLRRVRALFRGEVIASGGMRGEEDLSPVDEALAGGPRGAIFGRSLHDGRTTVARLAAALVKGGRP